MKYEHGPMVKWQWQGESRSTPTNPCSSITMGNINPIFDFMFQLNAPFLYYIYHIPLHVSSNFMLIIRRIHCIHTASGTLYVTLLRWPLSAQAVTYCPAIEPKVNCSSFLQSTSFPSVQICIKGGKGLHIREASRMVTAWATTPIILQRKG